MGRQSEINWALTTLGHPDDSLSLEIGGGRAAKMTTNTDGAERRLVFRMLEYWRGVCGDQEFPELGAIDPNAIADLWPHCFVLEMDEAGACPKFERTGDAFALQSGRSLTGLTVTEIPGNALADHATFFFREVLQKRAPVTRGGAYANAQGITMLYRSILLPLSRGRGADRRHARRRQQPTSVVG